MIISTIEELEESLADLLGDNFSIEEDNHGQLVIYSGLLQNEEGELEEFVSEEDLEEDPEVDPDLEPLDELDLEDGK